jgi:hypothetical protein
MTYVLISYMKYKKTITFSLSPWIWEKYFKDFKNNRSDYIIEMFLKGVLVETEQFKGNELKLIELIKANRELENNNSDLKKELEIVKARVITQEQRRKEREEQQRLKEIARKKKIEAKARERLLTSGAVNQEHWD